MMDTVTRLGCCGQLRIPSPACLSLLVTVLSLSSTSRKTAATHIRHSRVSPGTTFRSTTPAGYINVDFAMRNITKYTRESVRIRCEISGDPLPRYRWFKDGQALQENNRISSKTTTWGCRLRINDLSTTDSGLYTCEGRNDFGKKRTSGHLKVKKGRNPRPRTPKPTQNVQRPSDEPYIFPISDWRPSRSGYCQLYRGAACATYMSNRKIFVKHNHQQHYVDEKLVAMVAMVGSTQMSKRCGDYLIKALCYYELPLCNDTGGKARPQKLCRDECEALQNDVCAAEYKSTAKTAGFENKVWFPECNLLPKSGSKEAEDCVVIGVPIKGKVNPDHKCYNSTGVTYLGTVDRTRSGFTCQKWMTHSPQHDLYAKTFKSLGDHNYCRNPMGTKEAPWCFTTNPAVPREVCSIPQCSGHHKEEGTSDLWMILIPSIAVPLVILTVVTIFCVLRCHRSSEKGGKSSRSGKSGIRAKEFSISSLRFYQELGENRFGKVYRGELVGYCNDNTPIPVAVKTLKDRAPAKLQKEFLKDMEIISERKHPNLSCMLGVVSREEPYCMIHEFLCYGNLHEYLMCHSPHSDVSVSDDNGTDSIIEHTEMVYIVLQIAAGMEYLASQKVVHKDLATRNVLVGDNLLVKVSDFGTCKDMYPADYYCIHGKEPWPIRWMPPEAIKHGHFTSESDVWSYGVVLWEVFSFGLQPYYGYSNQEVLELVTVRQLLPCPEDCPAHIYSIMVECWQEMPIRRPSFRELLGRLRSWRCDLYGNPVVARSIAHSTSTHHSGHSGQHSHHSSTGPSNNTATTGLSAVSQHGPFLNASNIQFTLMNKPVIQPLPTPLPPAQMSHLPAARMPYLYPGGSSVFGRKPSPPGSVISHKSTSAQSDHSGCSSLSNERHLLQNNLNQPMEPANQVSKLDSNEMNNGAAFSVPRHTPTSPVPLLVEQRTWNM